MIARHWKGWTQPQNADAYEALLKNRVLPALSELEGYKGGYVLRRDVPSAVDPEVEFIVLNFFDSLVAVQRFAGPNFTISVFEPEARSLLKRVEPFADHFEVRASTLTGASPQPAFILLKESLHTRGPSHGNQGGRSRKKRHDRRGRRVD
jgi:hypothetical protein